jgi:L-asparaginase
MARSNSANTPISAKGIVIQGLGWGNVNLPMFAAIKEAIDKGVPHGRVLPNYGFEGGGKTLVEAGAIMGDDLSSHRDQLLP